MSSSGFRPNPLNDASLPKLVTEALTKLPDEKNPESYHALFGHVERGLSTDDVIHGIQGEWTIARKTFNEDEWQWKYEMDCESIDGEPLTIIVAVDTKNREFRVITRWRNES
jgi:hypothetical protein